MAAEAAKLELVRQVADAVGVRVGLPDRIEVPTVADYVPRVMAAATPATRRSYKSYWLRAGRYFAERRLDELMASDIAAFHQHVVDTAPQRGAVRLGRYAGVSAIRAMRRLFRNAANDGLVHKDDNPALKVPLPRRLPSVRRGLTPAEIADINRVLATGGNDVVLDLLLYRLHLETACRRGGALGLRRRDLDVEYCRVALREKGGTLRWQPISPTLAAALLAHNEHRSNGNRDGALLRRRDGRPLTARRYDSLWRRVRRALPWAAELSVSAHWLRHTTLTWVERSCSYAVARAYAGHTDAKGGSTLTYIKGLCQEVATALAWYTGEAHPLALPDLAVA